MGPVSNVIGKVRGYYQSWESSRVRLLRKLYEVTVKVPKSQVCSQGLSIFTLAAPVVSI
jgi:hypothetical protein